MKEITIKPKLVNFEPTNDGAFVADVEVAPNWVIRNVVFASLAGEEPRLHFFTSGKPLFKVNCGDPKRMNRAPVIYPKWLKVMIADLFAVEVPRHLAKRAEKSARRSSTKSLSTPPGASEPGDNQSSPGADDAAK